MAKRTPTTLRKRIAIGQSQRKRMPRTALAAWLPKLRRADPLKLLANSMRGRVPALIPIKIDRMTASPFGYFRGAVPGMAYDLSLGPNTGIITQLCGDAHVRNLGAFAASDGRLVFDINDFDETIHGPFEWDVKRMATSLILAGCEAGAKSSLCCDATRAFLKSYRTAMHNFAQMPVLELAHFQVHRLHTVEPVSQILNLAERATPLHNLETLTQPALKKKSFPRIFKTIEPILTRVHGDQAHAVLGALTPYAETLQPERLHFFAQYTPLDVAFKVVGTGSVGLRDYCVYLQGNGTNDPLFLQVKEEPISAYASYLGKSPVPSHQGRRVVEGQRAMQFQSDPFLGYTTIQGRDFLVRQLNDHKAAVEMTELKSAGLLEYAIVCGETLARGHARSGDPGVIAGYIGASARFDTAIADFATAYAEQTEHDWQTFVHSRTNKPHKRTPHKSK
ncbi:MAG TPA: DUF2252 domain-containing protein [Acidobacteriaceae bacterium]|jgi:uncharacterized protein (DUF2252 family)|nr:DUF2252 domain-containing protein [Acidobacteriaceae bacterium]